MAKRQFFASDEKAKNHINKGAKKNGKSEKMKGRREENNLGPGLYSHFSKAKSLD